MMLLFENQPRGLINISKKSLHFGWYRHLDVHDGKSMANPNANSIKRTSSNAEVQERSKRAENETKMNSCFVMQMTDF